MRYNLITGVSLDKARESFWNHRDGCCQIYDELGLLHPILGTSLVSSFTQLAKLHYVVNNLGSSYSVLLAVATFSQRQATDYRDKVYGMLGLGKGKYADLVDADYSRSAEEVCEDLAFKSVEQTGTLEFLSHLFVHENDKLPKFIPDWTGSYEWSEAYGQRLDYIFHFNASLNTTATIKRVSSSSIIMPGVVFDKISTTASQTLCKGDSFESFRDAWEELHRLAGMPDNSTQPYPYSGEPRLVALWHSLCGGMETLLQDSNRQGSPLKGSSDLTRYWKLIAYLTARPEEQASLRDPEIQLIYQDIETATRGRRFFRSESGCFGFGPKSCRTGDVIAVLAGGTVPYVLHPVLCSRRDFTLLGDSYVHGIMDGEVFEILPNDKREFATSTSIEHLSTARGFLMQSLISLIGFAYGVTRTGSEFSCHVITIGASCSLSSIMF